MLVCLLSCLLLLIPFHLEAKLICRKLATTETPREIVSVKSSIISSRKSKVLSDFYGKDFRHYYVVDFKKVAARKESKKSKAKKNLIVTGKYRCIEM